MKEPAKYVNFGKELKKICKKYEVTQKELSKELGGVSIVYISQFYSGLYIPNPEQYQTIMELLYRHDITDDDCYELNSKFIQEKAGNDPIEQIIKININQGGNSEYRAKDSGEAELLSDFRQLSMSDQMKAKKYIREMLDVSFDSRAHVMGFNDPAANQYSVTGDSNKVNGRRGKKIEN